MQVSCGTAKRSRVAALGLLTVFLVSGCFLSTQKTVSTNPSTDTPALRGTCSFGPAVESPDGIRRLALIVGVGQYKNPKVPDLLGPPEDAKRFYQLLTGENGYRFPQQNVCLLLDEDATMEGFKAAFEQSLVERVRKQDVAVIYYAGHGSRTRDNNGDEPDEWDETFMLHDARSGGVGDLRDDDFNALLTRLYAKTDNISVFIDSCNSGTATRGDDNFTARFFDPPDETAVPESAGAGDRGAGWAPAAMPGTVVFTAASDGTPALERDGRGIFTDALLAVFGPAFEGGLTYAQAARQIPPLVAAESYQIPYFQGDLGRAIFGNVKRERPLSWEVVEAGPPLALAGPPLPGLGVGAELRVYDGGASGSDTQDPQKGKATVVIDEITGLNARAHVVARGATATQPAVGDMAVLLRPADANLGIAVTLRPALQDGGIGEDLASRLQLALDRHVDANKVVTLVRKNGDFELSVDPEGRLVVRGPENRVRAVLDSERSAVDNLWQHARQRALRQLRGEGGSEFTDNRTLQVQLVPAKRQNACARGVWQQAPPNQEQVIPLCHQWNVKVALSPDAPAPLLVGGVILSTDGSTFGFPFDGRAELLRPGQTTVFAAPNETFVGTPPLDVSDQIIVFGTKETNPVPWHLLTDTSVARAVGPPKHGLYRVLDRYLQPGSRGVSRPEEDIDETTWTLSSITMRVEANTRFAKAGRGVGSSIDTREYTIKNFDIRPYLPGDEASSLYKLLQQADRLAQVSAQDGYGYKQHDWSLPSDRENLGRGIDCSRAIWYAFTRSGLPYNDGDRYLTTAQMVADDSAMADQFGRCDSDPNLRLGDILVYRDDQRGDGHVVMVIDPDKRIAWGSHGWDGNARELPVEPDTGVEYQLIKYKSDWERWDRTTMKRKACWRHRGVAADTVRFRGALGLEALEKACSPRQCRI